MVALSSPNPRLNLRFGDYADISKVMDFINSHWKKSHILSRDRALLEFLYLEKTKRLNFVIATDTLTDRCIAILGFIPTNSMDSRVSLALWRAVNDADARLLKAGLASLRYLVKELSPRSLLCVGIELQAVKIYNYLGYFTEIMDHYLIINAKLTEFKILVNPPRLDNYVIKSPSNHKVDVISTVKELNAISKKFNFMKFGKDTEYLIHRYLKHPQFDYSMRHVAVNSKTVGLIVTRRCFANDRSCIRIIDVLGGEPCISVAIGSLVKEMEDFGDEYIDLVSWGLDHEQIKRIGFIDRRHHKNLVVPEHFMPFVSENKDISIFTNSPDTEQLFKGDGDMDRPN